MCTGLLPSKQPGPTTTNGGVDDDDNDKADHINGDERVYEQQMQQWKEKYVKVLQIFKVSFTLCCCAILKMYRP